MTFDPTTATVEDLRKEWVGEYQLSGQKITWLLDYAEHLENTLAPEKLVELGNVLEFYADPMTYFAIAFFPDHPAGEFMDDFSETELGMKPGKLARSVLYRGEEKAVLPKRVEVKVAIDALKLGDEVKACLMAIWTEITQAGEFKVAKVKAWNGVWKRRAKSYFHKLQILKPAFAKQVKLTKEHAAHEQAAREQLAELRKRFDTRKCPVLRELCHEHNYIHGMEAEELRSGIEKILEEHPKWQSLQSLLDRVDARDSVAYLEARKEERREEELEDLPRFARGADERNEICLGCGKHISRHYGMTEYRCNPMEDEDARATDAG